MIALIYFFIAFILAVPFGRYLRSQLPLRKDVGLYDFWHQGQVAAVTAVGFVLGLVWPLAVPFGLSYYAIKKEIKS